MYPGHDEIVDPGTVVVTWTKLRVGRRQTCSFQYLKVMGGERGRRRTCGTLSSRLDYSEPSHKLENVRHLRATTGCVKSATKE